MVVRITKVIIEGFGSIQRIVYDLSKNGLHTIIGPNGAGKTTILNAIAWGLYRQPIKKSGTIQPWPHIPQGKGTMVKIFFRHGPDKIQICRCLDYSGEIGGKKGGNRLIIYENGTERSERDKKDGNTYIKEKIGYSFDLFKQTVLFGQALKRLTQEDGPTKKKVFDEAFETLFINRAKDIAVDKLDSLNKEHNDEFAKSTMFKRLYDQTTDEYLRQKKLIEKFEEDRDLKIKEIEASITELYKKVKEVKGLKGLKKKVEKMKSLIEKDNLSDKEFRASLDVNKIESEIEIWKGAAQRYKDSFGKIPKVCPECKQSLPKAGVLQLQKRAKEGYNEAKRKIKALQVVLEENNKIWDEYKESIKVQEAKNIKIGNLQRTIREMEDQVLVNDGLRSRGDDKMDEIAELKKKEPPSDLRDFEERKNNNMSLWKESEEKDRLIIKKIQTFQWMIDDPLSNSGLKAYIFADLLAKVNRFAKGYNYIVGFDIKVYVDMTSAHKNIMISIFKNKNEVPYEDLSGGQKQLVDVILALSLNDTVTSIKPINILFMDEVFESLDEANIEIVGDLISKKSVNKSIHLITHHSKFVPSNSFRTELQLNSQGQTVLVS